MTTASFETTEFRRTFRQETDDLLRTRLIWFISIWGGLGLIMTTVAIVMVMQGVDVSTIFSNGGQKAFFFLTTVVWFGAYLGSLLLVLSKRVHSQTIIYITMGLVMLDGVQGIGTRVMDMTGGPALAGFLLAHFIACCLFPVGQRVQPHRDREHGCRDHGVLHGCQRGLCAAWDLHHRVQAFAPRAAGDEQVPQSALRDAPSGAGVRASGP